MIRMVVSPDGSDIWLEEQGEIHRLDGPAITFSDGSEEWWVWNILVDISIQRDSRVCFFCGWCRDEFLRDSPFIAHNCKFRLEHLVCSGKEK